jgi:hypothetical protein
MLGVALGLSAAIFILNEFGQVAAYIACGTCVAIALVPSEKVAILVVNFVAAQSCINALLDIRVLFRTEMVINGQVVGASDAHNMADASFGSHWHWASAWLLWSFVCFYVALRLIYLRHLAAEQLAIHSAGNAEARSADAEAAVAYSASPADGPPESA